MINNRQNGNGNGRRRGRGGQPQRGGQSGAPDRGSRLDNRARGNAAQLLEKYKTLARDAQMQGDRVNTEYYLQFADHYFRVLSESRSRFEEQNAQRRQQGDYRGGDDYNDDGQGEPRPVGVGPDAQGRPYDDAGNDGDGDEGGWDDGDVQPQAQPQAQPQGHGRPRREAGDQREPRGQTEQREPRSQPEQRPRRTGNGGNGNGANGNGGNGGTYENGGNGYGNRYDSAPAAEAAPERIEMDRIPPSLTADAPVAAAAEPDGEATPRRRTRRPRAPEVTTEA